MNIFVVYIFNDTNDKQIQHCDPAELKKFILFAGGLHAGLTSVWFVPEGHGLSRSRSLKLLCHGVMFEGFSEGKKYQKVSFWRGGLIVKLSTGLVTPQNGHVLACMEAASKSAADVCVPFVCVIRIYKDSLEEEMSYLSWIFLGE